MLSTEQYIGVAALFVIAASTWFFVVSRPPESISSQQEAEAVWQEAGQKYQRMLKEQPALRRHKGAMVLPAVSL